MSRKDKIEPETPGGKGKRIPQIKDFEMRIARDGTWFHQGAPIKRLPLVKLFATEMAEHFRTNLDEWVEAGPEHPIRVALDEETGEPSPYIMIKDAPGGGLEALIARPVFYQLVELAETREINGEEVLGLWSHGQFFTLGRTSA